MSDDKRAATVICTQPCHFLTIDGEKYKSLLMQQEQKAQEKMLDFLRQIPYLRNFPGKLAQKLSFQLEPITYPHKGITVLREGEQPENVVLIRSGEFEIVRERLSDDQGKLI